MGRERILALWCGEGGKRWGRAGQQADLTTSCRSPTGVAACATRLADALRARDATNIRALLAQAPPSRDVLLTMLGMGATQQVGRPGVTLWRCDVHQ